MRYKLTLSYDGSLFCGWQRQSDSPSVQQTLENALGTLLREEVQVTGAGRTDAGVHALRYVAHFDSHSDFDCGLLCRKLNAILPASVAVHSVENAAPDFHARFDAVRREYKYYLHRSKDPFAGRYSYLYAYPELDLDVMNKAASLLVGTHDFSSFEKVGSDNKTSVCTVYEAVWEAADSDHWCFTIAADRFLRNMVRAIVGTLLEVGRGKRSVGSITTLLESRDRCSAGESVPGHALFLSGVEY